MQNALCKSTQRGTKRVKSHRSEKFGGVALCSQGEINLESLLFSPSYTIKAYRNPCKGSSKVLPIIHNFI